MGLPAAAAPGELRRLSLKTLPVGLAVGFLLARVSVSVFIRQGLVATSDSVGLSRLPGRWLGAGCAVSSVCQAGPRSLASYPRATGGGRLPCWGGSWPRFQSSHRRQWGTSSPPPLVCCFRSMNCTVHKPVPEARGRRACVTFRSAVACGIKCAFLHGPEWPSCLQAGLAWAGFTNYIYIFLLYTMAQRGLF